MFGRRSDTRAIPALSEWRDLLARFPQAEPGLLSKRELRRRTDTKFVLAPAAAVALVSRLSATHAVLRAGDELIATYRTLYFDTPELTFFHAHRRGFRVRCKARIRHYADRRLSILEVKARRSEMETSKQWRAREYGDDELTADDRVFFAAHTRVAAPLVPQVFSHFRRVTLLGLDANERVTIDLDLGIESDGERRPIDGVAIVEVKQWPRRRDSLVMTTLRAAGIRPGWASKYCTAIALTHPELRRNALLPGLRSLTGGAA